MAECIFTSTGGGGVSSDELNARAAQVLAGRSYVGADTEDEAGTGTMPNIGGVQRTLRAGESMAIPQGYHDGTGAVAVVSLAEQTPGTAAARDILAGKSAWVDGQRVDGSIPVINTMGPSGTDPRGCLATEYGIDFNAHTLWMHAPYHNAYYMRSDGYPHICMDAEALGDAVKEQVLQGARATSKYGLKFEGAIPRWTRTGDIGGQGVVDAWENTMFSGDYGARGRGVFARVPGGWYVNPDVMWAYKSEPGLFPQNIKQGVNILGVWGSMPDYASSCIPFDGAHFDGVHLSGWAEGLINTRSRFSIGPTGSVNSARSAEVASAIGGTYSGGGEPVLCLWVLTPSVVLTPFRRALVTVSYSTNALIMSHGNGVNIWAGMSRVEGTSHNRPLIPIREAAASGLRNQSGRVTLDIPLDGVSEQGFIVVAVHGSNFRRRDGSSVFSARLERIELIA